MVLILYTTITRLGIGEFGESTAIREYFYLFILTNLVS